MKKEKTICPQGKPKQKDKFRRQERKIHEELGRRVKGETGIRKERGQGSTNCKDILEILSNGYT